MQNSATEYLRQKEKASDLQEASDADRLIHEYSRRGGRANDEQEAVRTFETGATRDTDEGKLDYEGFISPRVLKGFAEYMHKHRVMSDGSLRSSDNWQKGMPYGEYLKSAFRHFVDVLLYRRGDGKLAREPLKDALYAIMFNVQGMLFELTREDNDE